MPGRSPDLQLDLERIALGAEGWAAILDRLSRAAGRRTWLVAMHGGVLASSDGSVAPLAASDPASGVPASDSIAGGLDAADISDLFSHDGSARVRTVDGIAVRAIPVLAGRRRLGILVMEEPVDRNRQRMLQAAVLPVAIEAVRRDAVAVVTAESASRLIDELRYGSMRDPERVLRSAERFGLHLDRPHAAAVFAYDGPNQRTWATAVRWIEAPVRQEGPVAWTVLSGDVPAELHRIRRRLEGIVGDAPVLGSTGPVVDEVNETPRSFQESEVVLALLRQQPGTRELSHDTLGLAGILVGVPAARLREFVLQALGPILDREELLATLAAWYDENGSRAAVAHRLNVHRNSVGYRIGRVRELLGADPLEPRMALRLRGALEARRVLLALESLDRA